MKVGDTVKLNEGARLSQRCPEGRENHLTAKVRGLLDVEGGVYTDRDLAGCRYWNVEDLVVVA